MSNLEALVIVLIGAIIGGTAMHVAWCFGFAMGEREVSKHWLNSIKAEEEIKKVVQEATHATHATNGAACKCGGDYGAKQPLSKP